jgi:hypothetical protein
MRVKKFTTDLEAWIKWSEKTSAEMTTLSEEFLLEKQSMDRGSYEREGLGEAESK